VEIVTMTIPQPALPAPLHQGSIFENQRTLRNSCFGTADAPKQRAQV
jgi:hypothetical protein